MEWYSTSTQDNLYYSKDVLLASIYNGPHFCPTIWVIPEYSWTTYYHHADEERKERFNKELGVDSFTSNEELIIKIETLYRLHGYD